MDAKGTEEPPDAQSDLFALGVTLYQLLTDGKLPYGEVLPFQSGRYFRDPTMLWKLLLAFSSVLNLLLVYWVLFLPK